MMPEIEQESSVIDLELIAQQEIKKKNKQKAAKEMIAAAEATLAQPKIVIEDEPSAETPPPATVEATAPPAPVQHKAATPKRQRKQRRKRHSVRDGSEARHLAKQHDAERRMLQKSLNEQAKKRERDIRELMEKALKNHFVQLDKERADYLALLGELKETIASQSKDAMNSTQHLAATAAEAEVERMVNWFHDEFMKELDRKSQEYEALKASSEEQVNKMSEESDGKSRQIMMLDEQIKEVASLLPKDVRLEIYEELGLHHLAEAERKAAEQGKHEEKAKTGLFSRLSQLFKRKPAKAIPKPKPKKEKEKQAKKSQHKRGEPQEVIAQ